jgi:hypothetical protein
MKGRLCYVVLFIGIIMMALDRGLSFIQDMLSCILLCLQTLTRLIDITILKVVIESSLCFDWSFRLML